MENQSLVADLVGWLAEKPRPYSQVMDVWRTSCPRLSIWEDAVDFGFVRRVKSDDGVNMVEASADGRQFLRSMGR